MRGVTMRGGCRVAVEEYPDPVPGEGEVLIRIRASALCGSEFHAYRGSGQPFNGGHEAMGVVVEARNARRVREGQRVGIHAVWGCGACEQCAAGRYTYCDSRLGGRGTHAEFIAAPEHVLLPLDDEIDDAVGVMLTGDGLGVAYHAGSRLHTRPGEVVCVIGVGPVGLGNVLLQSFRGSRVVAIDMNDYRLGLASELGAEQTINSAVTDPVAAVLDLTGGRGAPWCIECVGREASLRLALQLAGKAGTVMAVGEQGPVPLSISEDLIRRDITLMGSWFFHYAEYPAMRDLYKRGLRVDRLVTHRFPLDQADTAFAEFAAGRTGKALLIP